MQTLEHEYLMYSEDDIKWKINTGWYNNKPYEKMSWDERSLFRKVLFQRESRKAHSDDRDSSRSRSFHGYKNDRQTWDNQRVTYDTDGDTSQCSRNSRRKRSKNRESSTSGQYLRGWSQQSDQNDNLSVPIQNCDWDDTPTTLPKNAFVDEE